MLLFPPLYDYNIYEYKFLITNLWLLIIQDIDGVRVNGFLYGYTPMVWGSILLQVCEIIMLQCYMHI
jgi:hypothetical protein